MGVAVLVVLLAIVLVLVFAAYGDQVTYPESAMITNPQNGQSDLTTRVDNTSGEERSVTVTSGGILYRIGKLALGEAGAFM
jgi:hypothetical protein